MNEYGSFPNHYRRARLSEICVSEAGIQTGPFGSQLHKRDYVPEGTPIITVEHLGENRILHTDLPRVSNADRTRLERYSLRGGDIVFSRVGSVDRRAIVRSEEDGWLFSGRCLRVRPDPSVVDPRYLSWLFGLPAFKEYMRSIAFGATMPTLNTKLLSDVPVFLPPLADQRTIATVFDVISDKIEVNRRMNETLEGIARAIFKSWFVDFDPVRAKMKGRQPFGMDAESAALFSDSLVDSEIGPVPRDWKMGKVGDLVSLSRAALNPLSAPDQVFNHYSLPAFDESRRPIRQRGEEIRSNKFVVPERCILLSRLNPRIPRVWLPSETEAIPSICSTEFAVAVPNLPFTVEFIYGLFCSQDFQDSLAMLVTGTSGSHQRVKPGDLLNMSVLIPEHSVVHAFTQLARPLLAKARLNIAESRTLAVLRDTLLPKLLSGEVRIRDAEQIAEAAL